MITKFLKYNEGIKWYSKGKFEEDDDFEDDFDIEEDKNKIPWQTNKFWTILTEEPYFTNALKKIGHPDWNDPNRDQRMGWVKNAKKISVGFNGKRWWFGSAKSFSNNSNFMNMGELGKIK